MWDDNGNLFSDGNSKYRYDQAGHLISTTLGSTTSLFNYSIRPFEAGHHPQSLLG